MTTIGEVTVTNRGTECEVQWRMKFDSLSEEDDALYYCPRFSFEGEEWWLGMYPNGSEGRGSSGHIHLRLFKCYSYNPPIKVTFAFSLRTVNGESVCKKQETKVFEGRCLHDIALFMQRADFQKRRSEFLEDGFLTVGCTLKRLGENVPERAACAHCKILFDENEISIHEKRCRVKCPHCSDIVLLEEWHNHECRISRAEVATNTTEPFVGQHYEKIVQDFKKLLLNQEACDVLLRVKGREFQAHKAILAARSPVFASTFRNDMKEKESGIVDIEDCDPSVFPDFLFFLYSGVVDNLSEENVFGLFAAADKYDVTDLRGKCLEFLKANLSVKTFCETLSLALMHGEAELVHLATDFFIKNAKYILVTVQWQSFAAENPTQSNELFIKFVKSVERPNS